MQKFNDMYQKRKYINFIKEDNSNLFVELIGNSFLIRENEGNIDLIHDLLIFLDEPHSKEEIIRRFINNNENINKNEIEDTINKLSNIGIIEKYEPRPEFLDEKKENIFKRELSFFNLYSPFLNQTNYEYLNKLRHFHIIILNLGLLGVNILSSCIDLGIGKITCLDSEIINNEDIEFDPLLYSKTDIGKKRITLYAEKYKNIQTSILQFGELKNKKKFCDYTNNADLILSACDIFNSSFNRFINKILFNLKKHVLYIETDHVGGRLGPTLIPGETACFECLYHRERSNLDPDYLKHFDYFEQLKSKRELKNLEQRIFLPIYKLLAHYASLEILKIATGYISPGTLNGIYLFDFLNYRIEFHNLLKFPYCPTCGYIDANPPILDTSLEVFFDE